MSDSIEIPEFAKKDMRINAIETHHGARITISLSFNHRKDCLLASQFLTNIISAMIADDPEEGEQ